MAKTLAELRAAKARALPTRIVRVCLDLGAVADVQRLQDEKHALELDWERRKGVAEDGGGGAPLKMAEGRPDRLAGIADELAALYDVMREAEGELLLRAIPGGKWLLWKDENPARDGNAADAEVAYGVCNAVALVNDLGRYVAEWNGEPIDPEAWDEWLADSIAPADLRDMAGQVVAMHESPVVVPKSPSASSETGSGDTA